MHLQQLQPHLGRVSHCSPRVPAPQHCRSYTACVRRPQTAVQAQPSNSTSGESGTEANESKPPRRKRGPYKRHKDPAEVSANYRAAANRLVEYGGELITAIERAGRISGRARVLPPGAKYSSSKGYNPPPTLALPPGPWHCRVLVCAPRSSQEGGTESPYHHWKDALQLAAHELGVRQAKDHPDDGVHVVTSAGKEYFKTVLPPSQPNYQLEGLDPAEAREAVVAGIKARMVEIHEQLLRWPQIPFASARTV